ncbi:MAG: hypothetical protein OHK0015_51900 [Chloroflexi bacterium OHK40]
MGQTTAERPANETGVQRWREQWRQVRRQLRYVALTLVGIGGWALLLGAVAAGLQARRDELRAADVLLIVVPATPSEAFVDHCLELIRRGYAPRAIALGSGGAALEQLLASRGVGEGSVVVDSGAGSTGQRLRAVSAAELRGGAASALVAGEPADILAWLKLVSDTGLRAYGAPVAAPPLSALSLVRASTAYWLAVLQNT